MECLSQFHKVFGTTEQVVSSEIVAVHVAGVCRGRGENLFDEGELCSEYFFKVKEVIWVNSFDGNHLKVVYKIGMNESCFGKSLWAFVLCFEKDEFVFFGDLTFASFMILILVGFIGIKAQLPFEVLYPALLGFTFVLWLFSGSSWLMGLFLIGLLVGGVLLANVFLQNLARS
jgi:hypothetical protein